MAFDTTGFFTILGKYVKAINVFDGYHAASETLKEGIRDAYEGEDLHDIYATVPTLFSSFQGNVNSFIDSLITDLSNLILDRDYVTEQLNFYETGVTAVLNAIYNELVDNSDSLTASVVSLNSVDTDKYDIQVDATTNAPLDLVAKLFCSRTLDGVNSPGNGVTAHLRYDGVESQLAKSTNVHGEITVVTSLAAETLQLFSDAEETGPYELQDEEPGTGPALVNAQGTRVGLTNPGFDSFTGDDPDNWTMAGGTGGTDWEQDTNGVSYGEGCTSGLKVNTAGVTLQQQITGLSYNKAYMAGVFAMIAGDVDDNTDIIVKLVNGSAVTIKNLGSQNIANSSGGGALTVPDYYNLGFYYEFFSLASTVNLNDLYLNVEVDAITNDDAGGTTPFTVIYQAAVVPVTFYNGVGWVYWNPKGSLALGQQCTVPIANNDAGVFQAFFRKAFNVQMPTSGSPTISDTLAT